MKRTFVTSIVLTVPVALSVIVYLAPESVTHVRTHAHGQRDSVFAPFRETKDILAEFSINQMNVLNIVLCAADNVLFNSGANYPYPFPRVRLSRVVIHGVRGFCARGIYTY